jgi:hypothetical protein
MVEFTNEIWKYYGENKVGIEILLTKAVNPYMVPIVRKLIQQGFEERDRKIFQTNLVKTDGISKQINKLY